MKWLVPDRQWSRIFPIAQLGQSLHVCWFMTEKRRPVSEEHSLKNSTLNIYIFGLKQRHKENLLKRLETYAAGISETLDETVTHVVTAIKVPSEFLQEVDKRYNVDHDHADTNAFSSKQFFKYVGKICSHYGSPTPICIDKSKSLRIWPLQKLYSIFDEIEKSLRRRDERDMVENNHEIIDIRGDEDSDLVDMEKVRPWLSPLAAEVQLWRFVKKPLSL